MAVGIIVIVVGALLFAMTYASEYADGWPQLPVINTVERARRVSVLIVAIGVANILLTVV